MRYPFDSYNKVISWEESLNFVRDMLSEEDVVSFPRHTLPGRLAYSEDAGAGKRMKTDSQNHKNHEVREKRTGQSKQLPLPLLLALMHALEHGLNLDPRLSLPLNSLLVSYILKLLLPSFPLLSL